MRNRCYGALWVAKTKCLMKTNFCIKKERTVVDYTVFTEEEFKKALLVNKPKKIFNTHYSTKKPCWIITEYLDNDRVKYYADGWAQKEPVEEKISNIYVSWKNQGLRECYFENGD